MSQTDEINVSPEVYNLRLEASALYAKLQQMTQMCDDPDFLAWKKNREYELCGTTNTKLRKIHEKNPK